MMISAWQIHEIDTVIQQEKIKALGLPRFGAGLDQIPALDEPV